MRALRAARRMLAAAPALARTMRGQNRPGSNAAHLDAAARWLLAAQMAGQDGFAHSFDLSAGWQPAYPETSGYIVSSLLQVRPALPHLAEALTESARTAGRWLTTVQHPDGAIPDLAGRKQVFDTGQVLLGYMDLHRAAPDVIDADRIRLTCDWLLAVQESDGRFQRHCFNDRPHSYYSRVGAALIRAGALLDEPRYITAGRANLDWTLSQQRPNGFFAHLSFADEAPFLHTMCYVVEGLLDGYTATGHAPYREAVYRFCTPLLNQSGSAPPFSQYDATFTPVNQEYCLTGVAQWAALCFHLARDGRDPRYGAAGASALGYLRRRQIMGTGDSRLDGGLCGSAPPWGLYMRLAIPNWAVKFLIDALLAAPAGTEEQAR